MNATEQLRLPIEDITFYPPDESEVQMICSYYQKDITSHLKKRFYISVAVALFVAAFQILADLFTYHGHELLSHILITLLVVGIGFLVFNVISYVYSRVRYSMDEIMNHCECVNATIDECYDSRLLSRKTRQNVPNYILFHTEQGHCTTALPVKDVKKFSQSKMNEQILVIKRSPMGKITYDYLIFRTL